MCSLLLLAAPAFAQTPGQKIDAFRQKVMEERKKLGLDKKGERFGTPEVTFSGAAAGGGVNAVLCPGNTLVVKLKGIPPKSLVLPSTDEVEVQKESWAGTEWTGTLAAKKTPAPRTFSLLAVLGTTGQQVTNSAYLIGCKYTLVFEVDGATMTVKADLRALEQEVSGEWKKGGKVLGSRKYTLRVRNTGLDLDAVPDMADQMKVANAMTGLMDSPEWKALDKRQEATMQKMNTCMAQGMPKMQECMKPIEVEMKKLGDDRAALQKKAEAGGSAAFGCMDLEANLEQESHASQCSGKPGAERVPMKWSWTSP
jgi:hypothetical protein